MKRFIPRLLAGTMLALTGTGCIEDRNFDLSQLDTEMTVLKGAEFPVPGVTFKLGELLKLDGYDFITCDEAGDYIIRFDLDPISAGVTMPEFKEHFSLPVVFQQVPYTFGSVPEFISGKDQRFEADLSDMLISVGVESGIPVSFTATGTVETLVENTVQHSYHIDNLEVNPGTNAYSIRAKAVSDQDLVIPELGKLLSPFPDAVRVGALDLYVDADQEQAWIAGNTYDLTVKTRFKSPICFAENHSITLSIPLDAQLNLEQIGLKRALLNLGYDNSIPLNFSLVAYALDAEGNRIDGVQAKASDPVLGNTPEGGLMVELTTGGDLRFSRIVLELTVSADSRIAGMHINRNQEIRFSNISLSLPDGVQVRPDSKR